MSTEATTETALMKGSLRWCLENQESPYMRRLKLLLGDDMPYFNASLISLSHSFGFERVKPASLITAGIIAATLDVPIDKSLGFAFIIPYGELAQFQLGYKGFIQLALRSGQYAGMNAAPINDEALGGFDAIGDPIIFWEALDKTKPAKGYAFAWKLTTGFTKIVYWSKAEIEAHAARYSQAYKKKKPDSPWFTHFDEMGLKTVVKAGISKWGIMSVRSRKLQFALERDQSAAIDVDATPIYPDNETPSPTTPTDSPQDEAPAATLDDLTAKLQQTDADSAADGNVTGSVTPNGSVVEVAADVLRQVPALTLVKEVEAVTADAMTLDDMSARLQKAEHVSDVRALQLLWAGPKVQRGNEEKEQINALCAARIEEMRQASRKGKAK